MSKPVLYLSFDVETDGKTPLVSNMISIGICGLDKDCNEHFTFEANLIELPGHIQHPETMDFWSKNQDAWKYTQMNRQDILTAFTELSNGLKELSKSYKLIFCASPSNFDWMFFSCYYDLFSARVSTNSYTPYNIGYSCQDISSVWKTYRLMKKISDKEALELEKVLKGDYDAHCAIEDARAQGRMYVRLLAMM